MTVPKYHEFFPSFLTLLGDGKEHEIREIREYCANTFKLSEKDRNITIPSGSNLFRNRISWAQAYLKKAELIDTLARATCAITDLGKQVLAKGADCLTLNYVKQLQEKNEESSPSLSHD